MRFKRTSLPNKKSLLKAIENLDCSILEGFHVYVDIIHGCILSNELAEGRRVHIHASKRGLEKDTFIENKLINLYAKCGNMIDASRVFHTMAHQDVVSWSSIISGYAQRGSFSDDAFRIFQTMRNECRVMPNKVTFLCILESLDGVLAVERGKLVHFDIVNQDMELDIMLGTSLVNMYGKCGSVEDAFCVFDSIHVRDVVLWTAMITVYTQHGHGEETLQLFKLMECQGIEPNEFTFTSILCVCCDSTMDRMWSSRVHVMLLVSRIEIDGFVGAALLSMYAKSGRLHHARQVFDKLERRDVASWTALITGYAHHGFLKEALTLFQAMRLEGLKSDVVVGNALIDLYAKSGDLDSARRVFENMHTRDAISWSTLVSGYVQEGFHNDAIELYVQMLWQRVHPDEYTVSSILCACANLMTSHEGKWIHAYIIEYELEADTFVGNALVNMYAKCDSMEDANSVFKRVDETDLVSWNAMILGYGRHGCAKAAYSMLWDALKQGLKPDEFTLSGVLNACANVGMLAEGKEVHKYTVKTGFKVNNVVGNALIDMYAACGSLHEAHTIFEGMCTRDVISWSSMIGGWAQHGDGKQVQALCQRMQQQGLKPDEFTFSSLLIACNHAGLIEEGWYCFQMMVMVVQDDDAMSLAFEHYATMVDLLGRSGCLNEAVQFIDMLPIQPHCAIWMSLLAACRNHGNLELAKASAQHAFVLGLESAGAYVLLSNIYAMTNAHTQKMRNQMDNDWSDIDIASTWMADSMEE